MVLKVINGVSWYIKELMGDNDYAKYCAHLAAHHPDVKPPTEKEYWKQRWARESANPGSRCC
ncbi:YbdD/YjiX family protein [Corynebacterium sanguinis]|uniref:YbdD/YjiX family protein n=1 Tax=Corynebacterium sanguinis TaxID=2594913 RepID=UPI00223C448E|nr:YbdD/YjiX family protein [Corynebacterium sanguinis]MCT2289046.1 YbdD/YjiX family protein [Corynebacterium sanguinis]